MKFIKSDDLKLGMRLAKPIYNRDVLCCMSAIPS